MISNPTSLRLITRKTVSLASQPTIRPLRADEVGLATEWALSEGWNPGPFDARVFNAADPDSFLAVAVNGSPVGVISSVRMSERIGFLGFFVLSPEYRSSIYGWTLWQAALARLGDRVIGADGILARLSNYARYGLMPYYRTTSYHGVAPACRVAWRTGVALAGDASLAELAAYDSASSGLPRKAFLREWLALPDSLGLVLKRGGRLCGLGMARRCHVGVRIGPLQADDLEAAETLLDALVGMAPGEPFSIDCPDTNPAGRALLMKKGLAPGPVTARLYRGAPPVDAPARVYGQMSFALG